MLRLFTIANVLAGAYFAWLAYDQHNGWILGWTAIAATNVIDGVTTLRRRHAEALS